VRELAEHHLTDASARRAGDRILAFIDLAELGEYLAAVFASILVEWCHFSMSVGMLPDYA
jgi:hypothetical protein